MIFVSDTLRGAFGRAWRFSLRKPHRRKLLQDFAERPIFSVGVSGGSVPTHGSHPETWHALLSGIKAWWLSSEKASDLQNFQGWEDPCGSLQRTLEGHEVPGGIHLCVQHAGEILYFGDNVEHSTCSLSEFSLAVGAQGHTETWPDLHRAANRGDLSAVQHALAQLVPSESGNHKKDHLSSVFGRYGHAALHRAALHGFAEVVKHLLAARANPSQKDAEGLTPSFLAAFSGHITVLKALAPSVSLQKERDAKGATPLQWAVTQGHLEVVQFLLSRDVSVSTTNDLGGGPVSAAATMGHIEILKELLYHKGTIHETDIHGMTPLHWAALHGHKGVAQHLLRQRADPYLANLEKQRPVDLAQDKGVAEILRGRKRTRSKRRVKQTTPPVSDLWVRGKHRHNFLRMTDGDPNLPPNLCYLRVVHLQCGNALGGMRRNFGPCISAHCCAECWNIVKHWSICFLQNAQVVFASRLMSKHITLKTISGICS